MRFFARLTAVLTLLLGVSFVPAFAGPNAGGVLIVHECQLVRTYAYDCALDACVNADVQADLDFPIMWKVWAAFPDGSSPRLKAFVMGAQFPAEVIVESGGLIDPVGDFEIGQDGWPTVSGGGVGVVFGQVKTATLNDCYWLAGYAYSQGVWSLTPHPQGPTLFVDDSIPPVEDPVAAFGSLGFGVPGSLPCPAPIPQVGACCLEPGNCLIVLQAECVELCGLWFGEDVSCDPNPCPPLAGSACCLPDGTCELHWPNVCECLGGVTLLEIFTCDPNPCDGTPIEETSWGRIKAIHRP